MSGMIGGDVGNDGGDVGKDREGNIGKDRGGGVGKDRGEGVGKDREGMLGMTEGDVRNNGRDIGNDGREGVPDFVGIAGFAVLLVLSCHACRVPLPACLSGVPLSCLLGFLLAGVLSSGV